MHTRVAVSSEHGRWQSRANGSQGRLRGPLQVHVPYLQDGCTQPHINAGRSPLLLVVTLMLHDQAAANGNDHYIRA